ncbi:hypothetical protein [Pseudooceanicola sp.]|uniref:hypothetical protein n=1 Tax=Pseudooceanicola sp. TaxID=1914328 RepID=UPI003518EC24
MTDTDQFSDQIDPIMELMRSKLGIRARSFPAALARAGRRLPRPIRREGQVLAEALARADNPRLRPTLDQPRLAAAAEALKSHLATLDNADRRRALALDILGALAFSLLLTAALVIVLLAWRGFL